MDERYLQDEIEKVFDHALEECAEFSTACAKMRRWGAFSYNPLVTIAQREYNIDWVNKELEDVIATANRLKQRLKNTSAAELEEAFPLYD